MKLIESQNIFIVAHKIEAVQLIPSVEKDVVKVFMGEYGHSFEFDDEDEAVYFFELILREMKDL